VIMAVDAQTAGEPKTLENVRGSPLGRGELGKRKSLVSGTTVKLEASHRPHLVPIASDRVVKPSGPAH
jgi:hypothetical protein